MHLLREAKPDEEVNEEKLIEYTDTMVRMPQQTTVPQTGPTPSPDIIHRHHGKHATADHSPSDRAHPVP